MAILYPPGYTPPKETTPGAKLPGVVEILTDPVAFLKSSLATPTVGVGAPAAVVFKSITKAAGLRAGSALLGAGAGFVGASLLMGGGKQEQQQEAATPITQPQEQRLQELMRAALGEFKARAQQQAEARAAGAAEGISTITPTITPTYQITAGGQVEIGGVTTSTNTYTTTIQTSGISQSEISAQIGQLLNQLQLAEARAAAIPTITQTEEATSLDLGWIAAAAILGIGGLILLTRRKK